MKTNKKVFFCLLLKLAVTRECCLYRRKITKDVSGHLAPMLNFSICLKRYRAMTKSARAAQPWSFWRHLPLYLLKNPKGKVGAKPTSHLCERTAQVLPADAWGPLPLDLLLLWTDSQLSLLPVVHLPRGQAALVWGSSPLEHPSDWEVSWCSWISGASF